MIPSLLARVVLLATLVVGLAGAARAQVFNPETFTLDNGMQVVVVPNHRMPVVSHMVWYRVGSADEEPGKTGLAHFLEHLMFKGTEEVPSGEFSRIVARHGGRDNAFTSYDYTGYFQNIAVEHLEMVMRMEADRMTNLRLDENEVLTERDVVLEERRSRTDNNPSALLSEQSNAALYLLHPYRNPIIGWERDIRGLSREDALAFYERWYAPNNAILVVAGDITAEQLRPLAERTYGRIPAGEVPERIRPSEPPHLTERHLVMHDERVQQPSWSRRYIAPSYNTEDSDLAYPLQVLAEVIGGGSTSRIYQSLVVQQGLAVSAGAWYNPTAVDTGSFGVFASPRPGIEMDQLEAAMDEELRRILVEGLPDGEIERAKTRLRAAVVYARDSLHTGARVLGEALATGQSVEDVEAWPERIAAVTDEQVIEAARRVLEPTRSVTSILLPARAQQAGETDEQG
ncbi:pitrilysin family protein [Telmatospirillum sp. J64-1]|uniref:M16 family metallopeptidase n=1 Tax=Telmatospirillum sp. J64-1 TaxID=2502183 RepID=UPI00115C50C6|nr:pitrilysin family protein [Telmatospirillum sp. J64-1]